MIIYSEVLKKEFDTVEACEKAEAEYKAEQEKINEEKKAIKEERAARAGVHPFSLGDPVVRKPLTR